VIPLLLAALLAAPAPELKRARDRFEFGAWADCAAIVRQWLSSHPTASEADQVSALQMLGISEWNLGDRLQARSAFVQLLSESPDHKLDPFLVPPAIVELFEEVRREHEPQLGPLRDRKRALREQERLAEEARRRLLAEERVRSGPPTKIIRVEERNYILNWIPFGVGQFQNGHRAKATAIAAGELVLGVVNIGAILLHNQMVDSAGNKCTQPKAGCRRPPYNDETRTNLAGVDVAKYASAGLFWALYAYGVWDAHRYYVPRVETEISPRERGGTVSLRWDF